MEPSRKVNKSHLTNSSNHISACRINLPRVRNDLLAEDYINRVPGTKVNRKPRDRPRVSNNNAENSRENRMQDTKHLESMWRDIKDTKLKAYLAGRPVTFKINGQKTLIPPYSSTYFKKFGSDKRTSSEEPEYDRERSLVKVMEFALSTHVGWVELREAARKWVKMEENTNEVPFVKIAEMLGITDTQLKNFEFYKDYGLNLFERLRNRPFNRFVPDIMKQLAFSCWQKKDLDLCLYYLTESHAMFLKQDIIDKHYLYFCMLEEDGTNMAPFKTAELRNTLFNLQITDLKKFGSNIELFPTYQELINPQWHLVQLSAIFHSQNRFGATIGSTSNAPAIFISTFTTINGKKKRYSTTTFVDEPKLDPTTHEMNIAEQYQCLMMKNYGINDSATAHGRKRYWEIRAEHNEHMKSLVGLIEDDWIAPWNFLFPGNILNPATVQEITDVLQLIKTMYPKDFTDQMTGVIYKLIENFNCLDLQTKKSVHVLLEQILNVPKDERLTQCAEYITSVGEKIIFIQPRSPTILILDQELEKYPWEVMKCLKYTDVTRAPSLSMIYSLSRISRINHPLRSPEIDINKCTYVLNPDGSLNSVEARFNEYFKNRTGWTGFTNEKPRAADFQYAVEHKDLLVYCGHGNGSQILPEGVLRRAACRAVPLLMGCASTKVDILCPQSYGTSVVNSYFTATCRSIVGFLWEITDMECDRITADFIERFAHSTKVSLPECFQDKKKHKKTPRVPRPSIPRCVRLARDAATQFMTQAAVVNYGIPLSAKPRPIRQFI